MDPRKKRGRKVVIAFLGNSFDSLLSSIGRSRTRSLVDDSRHRTVEKTTKKVS